MLTIPWSQCRILIHGCPSYRMSHVAVGIFGSSFAEKLLRHLVVRNNDVLLCSNPEENNGTVRFRPFSQHRHVEAFTLEEVERVAEDWPSLGSWWKLLAAHSSFVADEETQSTKQNRGRYPYTRREVRFRKLPEP